MPSDRSARSDTRQRRMLQRLNAEPPFELGPGLDFDPDDQILTLDLRDTDPGLEIHATGLGVLLGTNPGLTNTGGLAIDLRDAEPGLERVATGLGILLAATPGLEFSTGLRVQLDGTTLTRAAGGLSVTAPEGRFTVTAIQVALYNAAIGELVRCNPAGGAFTVNLPASAAANIGRAIIVKNVNASANVITIAAAGADTIDTAASVAIAAGFGSFTLRDNGAGDWMTV